MAVLPMVQLQTASRYAALVLVRLQIRKQCKALRLSHIEVRCPACGTKSVNKSEGGYNCRVTFVQEFMRVYDVLREDLLTDDLIADQPKFSADYMRKVN